MEKPAGVVRANEAETTRIVENDHDIRLIRPDPIVGRVGRWKSLPVW